MKATEHAKRHLAAMSPERREQLEAEWHGTTTERVIQRAREGREAIKTLKTPAIEGLAVVLFPMCMVWAVLS